MKVILLKMLSAAGEVEEKARSDRGRRERRPADTRRRWAIIASGSGFSCLRDGEGVWAEKKLKIRSIVLIPP